MNAARAHGEIRAVFSASGARTEIADLHEAGGLRLKFPRVPAGCEAVLVNTAGGVVAGDHARLSFTAGQGAQAVVTTQAAEKIYKSEGDTARVDLALRVEPGACLEYLPQETILFDRARFSRRLEAEVANDGRLTILESIVFGRLGMGEIARTGMLLDQWRVRRGGALVFAEALRLDGPLSTVLDRPAVGAGARALATLLHVAPDAEAHVETVRDAAKPFDAVETGVSAWNGFLVLRLLSPSPERARACIVACLARLRGRDTPRVWQ
jgi:urease accessory protein